MSAKGTTVTFDLVGIRSTGSAIAFGGGTFLFGDRESLKGPFSGSIRSIGNEFELVEVEISHTCPAAGYYEIGYLEDFRDSNIEGSRLTHSERILIQR